MQNPLNGGMCMRKGNKKWFAALLALSLSAVTALGCSGGNTSESTNSAPANSTAPSSQPSASNDKKIDIKIAHVLAEDVTQHKMFLKLKELLEERSNGRFAVEIFPNAQMGGEREITESVQMGSITISAPSVGQLSNFSEALKVFDLPFIFKDKETAYKVLDGEVGTELLKGLESSGFIGLGFGENGWRQLTTKNGPITSPDQIQGIKLRTMEVPLHMAFWKEIGASPTPLAFTEVFSALSQGVVDGEENPLQLIYSMKFHEPNKYITMTSHIYDTEPLVINKAFMESLSAEDQQIIRDSAKEAITYLRDMNKEVDNMYREKLTSEGAVITDLTPEQLQVWVEKVKPIYSKYADEVGRDTLIKVLEAAGNTVALDSLK